MGLIIDGVSASDLILDGQSVSLYLGGNPPTKVWPTTDVVQITLGTGLEARDQLRAALTARGLDYRTVTEIPFDIELVGSGSLREMFYYYRGLIYAPSMDTSQVTSMERMFQGCTSLTSVPAMDTSSVTNMYLMFASCSSLINAPAMNTSNVANMGVMFSGCSSLAYVPDMDTSQVTSVYQMFKGCSSLTDGNVRLIGKHPNVNTNYMIDNSGLTLEPFYSPNGGYLVSLTEVRGTGTIHPLLNVTVPAGETWSVRIQGTMTKAYSGVSSQPQVRIGGETFGPYAQGAAVDCSGTVTSANSTIAIQTRSNTTSRSVSFVGDVTIEK